MSTNQVESLAEEQVRDAISAWAEQGDLSPTVAARVRLAVHRLARAERASRAVKWTTISVPAAALLLALTLALSPAALAWAQELPVVGEFISQFASRHRGWSWAQEHGMLQEVMASDSDNGYTLRIHNVLADPVETTIIWSVEGAVPAAPIFRWDSDVRFDGVPFVKNAIASCNTIDGVMVGSLEIDPLPSDSGTLELTATSIGDVEGKWKVSFPVDRSRLSELATTVAIGRDFTFGDGTLTVRRLVLTPTQTLLESEWQGTVVAPDGASRIKSPRLRMAPAVTNAADPAGSGPNRGTALLGPDGVQAVAREHYNGSGEWQADGRFVQRDMLFFDRLDPIPPAITVRLAGVVYTAGETRVPLAPGSTAVAGDGRSLTVAALEGTAESGNLMVTFAWDGANPMPYDDWQVVDDTGAVHQAGGQSGYSDGKNYHNSIRWVVPAGRQAVALISGGYWKLVDIGSVTVETGR